MSSGASPSEGVPEAVGKAVVSDGRAWMEICSRETETGAWKQRPEQIMKHVLSTIFQTDVEASPDGSFLRIRLRGKFFLYNQIRLLVGSAVAVTVGALPEEFIELALQLRVTMHMPMAPPTGLMLRTAGFQEMDQRMGYCAMDDNQARATMLPVGGFVLMSEENTAIADAFISKVEASVEQAWRDTDELAAWRAKLRSISAPSEKNLQELRQMAAEAALQSTLKNAEQAANDVRRRIEQLQESGRRTFVGVMPKRFASDLMSKFRLMPGWRISNLQHALAMRKRRKTLVLQAAREE